MHDENSEIVPFYNLLHIFDEVIFPIIILQLYYLESITDIACLKLYFKLFQNGIFFEDQWSKLSFLYYEALWYCSTAFKSLSIQTNDLRVKGAINEQTLNRRFDFFILRIELQLERPFTLKVMILLNLALLIFVLFYWNERYFVIDFFNHCFTSDDLAIFRVKFKI